MANSGSKRAMTRKAMGRGGKRVALEMPPLTLREVDDDLDDAEVDEDEHLPEVAIQIAQGIAGRWQECEQLRQRVQALEAERAHLYQRLRGQAFVLERGRGQVDFDVDGDGQFVLCVALRDGAQQMDLSVSLTAARELAAWLVQHLDV